MKWRRAEDQLTQKQRDTLTYMLAAGYTHEACMERFGLTHPEQVKKFYVQNQSAITGASLPGDKTPVKLSFRTTSNEIVRGLGAPRRRIVRSKNRPDSFDS